MKVMYGKKIEIFRRRKSAFWAYPRRLQLLQLLLVLLEPLRELLQQLLVQAQGLVAPLVFPLPPNLAPVLEEHRELLDAMGFDVEPYGGREVCLRTVPVLLRGRDPSKALEEILKLVVKQVRSLLKNCMMSSEARIWCLSLEAWVVEQVQVHAQLLPKYLVRLVH